MPPDPSPPAPAPSIDLHRVAVEAMAERGLRAAFSAAALDEAHAAARAGPVRPAALRDLRHLAWFSIDNDDTRDLDQLSVAERLAHVKGQLAPYEYPKEIEFMRDLLELRRTRRALRALTAEALPPQQQLHRLPRPSVLEGGRTMEVLRSAPLRLAFVARCPSQGAKRRSQRKGGPAARVLGHLRLEMNIGQHRE